MKNSLLLLSPLVLVESALIPLYPVVFTCSATPQPAVHRTTNAQGVPEYFSHPGNQRDLAADLPAVQRKRMDQADQLQLPPPTCRRHGGVKCSAGSDSDGSVVCYDGFRDSAQSFADNCTSARLVLAELRHVEGLKYAIVLRNTAGVVATDVRFSYKPPVGLAVDLVPVEGPEVVAAYGSAEYFVSTFKKPFETEPAKLEQKYLWITCGNCG